MSVLAKLNLKTVQRNTAKDPIVARRDKLIAGIDEQQRVLEAALRGETYTVRVTRKVTNAEGERVEQAAEKRARAWYFEQDNGWYVQCRYGARVLHLNGKSNAVWVATLKEVADVLAAFKAAAESGELDKAVAMAMARAK
ncbi:hypothetical protein XMM379_001910 [Aliiroseovarius sp. xm-m-379]|uniref:hypothetical protein n=1 Tax=unclassified Aliiroseovarius TaxID=2623558 RepID=UPI00156870C3|nr:MULTISPECIES: hypothetical protein [unclassified Aliiroseovarius]NRP25216.1 hypothetical protein [Aliiroseovarius sp. xm-m-379]NRP34015.1 hypothetical protein [Aliiroseovarius sp. xm-a-104]NRP50807.1 hypothetical protein [Aliiroseovarius sp. xm-m-354]NRQ05559.1 hypothetical protein [Aliiroseovarius sp. xm-m-309]NRQ08764.1 hypothetical protein [Aliiroseovarius sp. xm-v-201]